MSEARALSREFVARSILKILDEAETRRRWGAVTVIYHAGKFRCIKQEETIAEEK